MSLSCRAREEQGVGPAENPQGTSQVHVNRELDYLLSKILFTPFILLHLLYVESIILVQFLPVYSKTKQENCFQDIDVFSSTFQ